MKGWLKFHFSVFQPQDSICLCFLTDKNSAMKLQQIFQYTQIRNFWHCFHCCWRDLELLERNRLMPDIKKAIISVLKSYLVHFGSLKPHILYFHASIVEKFEVIEEKCTKPYSLSSVLTYKQIKRGV